MSKQNGRHTAYLVLLDVLERGAWAQFSLAELSERQDLPARERQLASALVYKTLENYTGLRYRLEQRMTRKWRKLDPEVRCSLLLGLSQILYFDRIPDSAAVNEAVRIVQQAGKRSASGFVNGVLRGLIREQEELPSARPDLHYGISPWLWLQLKLSLGQEEAARFMEAVNEPQPLAIRINRLHAPHASDVEEVLADLEANGFQVTSSALVPDMYRLAGSGEQRLTELPAWAEGRFTIQGEGSALAAHLLDARPGMRVLDACAAPGGKTAILAETMQNEGTLVAADLQASRVETMQATLMRLGARAESVVSDAERLGHAEAPPELRVREQFDRVLADVPCSNWGNLASKPELRWRGDDESLREMERTAARILDASAEMVKPGGRLVYSTCTLNPAENGQLVERFLTKHAEKWAFATNLGDIPGLSLLNSAKNDRIRAELQSGQLTLLPAHDHVPGFYIALLERKA